MRENRKTGARVGQREIAEAAGVDKSTVSRALRNDPRISLAVRGRVREIAGALGYRPDPVASAFAEARWREGGRRQAVNFGYLGFGVSDERVAADERFGFCRSAAVGLGYELIPLALNDGVFPRHLRSRLLSQNIRGVIISRLYRGKGEGRWSNLDELPWERCAWVCLAEGNITAPVHRVLVNAFRDTAVALETLAAKGYRRVLFVRESFSQARVVRRQAAAALLIRRERPEMRIGEVEMGLHSVASTPIDGPKSDVVLGTHSFLSREVAERFGVPSFASLHVMPRDRGKVAGMFVPEGAQERATVDLLDQMYRRGSYGLPEERHTLMLDAKWVDGASLPDRFPRTARETSV